MTKSKNNPFVGSDLWKQQRAEKLEVGKRVDELLAYFGGVTAAAVATGHRRDYLHEAKKLWEADQAAKAGAAAEAVKAMEPKARKKKYVRAPGVLSNEERQAQLTAHRRKIADELPGLLKQYGNIKAISEATGYNQTTIRRAAIEFGVDYTPVAITVAAEEPKVKAPPAPHLQKIVEERRLARAELAKQLPEWMRLYHSYEGIQRALGHSAAVLSRAAKEASLVLPNHRQPPASKPTPGEKNSHSPFRIRSARKPPPVYLESIVVGDPKIDKALEMLWRGDSVDDVESKSNLPLREVYRLAGEVREAKREMKREKVGG